MEGKYSRPARSVSAFASARMRFIRIAENDFLNLAAVAFVRRPTEHFNETRSDETSGTTTVGTGEADVLELTLTDGGVITLRRPFAQVALSAILDATIRG